MGRDAARIHGLGMMIAAQVRNHIIFLAKTTKHHPIPGAGDGGRDPKAPLPPPFAG